MALAVAYYIPHNDGLESGILDQPGQNTGLDLVDLYEVDGVIRAFASREEAETWLDGRKAKWNESSPFSEDGEYD